MQTRHKSLATDQKNLLTSCAKELGLELVGVTSASPFRRGERVASKRLRDGHMGELPWYTAERVRRGTRPAELLPGAKSVISVAVSYMPDVQSSAPPYASHGRVARYAWGYDYHKILKKRLRMLAGLLSERMGQSFHYRIYVDDGPMLDREVAWRAGVGFYGKNTNLLTRVGSWVFLGELITDLEFKPDKPSQKSCGTCTTCIPACPTGAITAPYVIDSNRCIAYLTIEHRGVIASELRPLIGDRVFGCDICQEVCPVNLTLEKPTGEPAFRSSTSKGFSALDLYAILSLSEKDFQIWFKDSPIRRATRLGLQRNACVVLGNSGDPKAAPSLERALLRGEPLVRGHAAWALGQLPGAVGEAALRRAWEIEEVSWVREEIVSALTCAAG